MPDQLTGHDAFGDVDHVVLEAPAVRPARVVARDDAEPVALPDRRRRRDREVQPQLVGERLAGEVEVRRLQARAEHGHEIRAVGLLERPVLRVQLVQESRQRRARVVLLELLVLVRRRPVPLVLQLGRDQQLVDQRVAEPRDLDPPAPLRVAALLVGTRHAGALPVRRSPHTDHVRVVVEHRDRHLKRDRVHAVAGEEVLAAAGRPGPVADRDEIEDGADVAEERIVTLACEDGRAVRERVHTLLRQRVVVRSRPRADVVGRGHQPAADDRRAVSDHLRDRVALLCAAEEERRRAGLEAEVPADVRLPVAVAVDVDVVPRGRRERVPVRPRGWVLARNHVVDQRDRVRLVRAAEGVDVRLVGRRILRGERSLTVARGLRPGRPAAKRDDRSCGDERRGECGDEECSHLFISLSRRPLNGRHVAERSPGFGDRFDIRSGPNQNRPRDE